jgi:predicted lipoprotein with Yx(FWY)xxD motif
MFTRILAPLAVLAMLSGCTTSDDAADTTDTAAAAATVGTVDGDLGTFLVDGDGRTLYLFTVDGPGVSNCDEACLQAWPPLLTAGDPAVAGSADATLLGTLTRADGTLQVTYAGWPLYLFAADATPGDVNGQGVNDVWFVVAPDGMMITRAADEPAAPASGGYGY